MILTTTPAAAPLRGRVTPPGDKSVSHRAAILGGLARGRTRIEGFLEAEDTLATLEAMRTLGASVARDGDRIEIESGRLRPPDRPLDLGNSGTGIRLLTGALAGHPDLHGAELELIGDASLSRRPMGRIIEPLSRMGARIESREGCAPLRLTPGPLKAHDFSLRIASAQVKSAILLAGLHADGRTTVVEPAQSRDHTERLLPAFGIPVSITPRGAGHQPEIAVRGPATPEATRLRVPADLSSAAFLIAAALLVPDSRITVGPVGVNPTRDGVLRVLDRMAPGCISRNAIDGGAGDEPMAELDVRDAPALAGIEIPAEWVSLTIDEFPLLMALAARARGETVIRGAEELRVKESDRLAVMSEQLRRLGVDVDERPDGARIVGGAVRGGEVDADGDHRIAMSLAVLGLVSDAPIRIRGAEWIRTSYPGFVDQMRSLGAALEWRE